MQPAVIQNLSLVFLAAVMNSHATERAAFGTSNAASFEWQYSGEMQTQSFNPAGNATPSVIEATSALSLIALSDTVFPDSRSLTDLERKDADEFFWSQFA